MDGRMVMWPKQKFNENIFFLIRRALYNKSDENRTVATKLILNMLFFLFYGLSQGVLVTWPTSNIVSYIGLYIQFILNQIWIEYVEANRRYKEKRDFDLFRSRDLDLWPFQKRMVGEVFPIDFVFWYQVWLKSVQQFRRYGVRRKDGWMDRRMDGQTAWARIWISICSQFFIKRCKKQYQYKKFKSIK